MGLIRMRKDLKKFKEQKLFCKNSNVKFYDFWFYKFVVDRKLLSPKKISLFFSVFGPRWVHNLVFNQPKFFFTGENPAIFHKYEDHFLNESDLSLGFDYIDHKKYLRFPLWLIYIIPPNADFEQVKKIVNKISTSNGICSQRNKFASLIASHDKKKNSKSCRKN